MLKIIKKSSMLILMFSACYIFSMSDQERLKELEGKIDSLFSAIPSYQKEAEQWTRTPGSKSMFTPKYLKYQLDRLRDLTQEAIQLRQKLGLEPARFEKRLEILQKVNIPSAREEVSIDPEDETWRNILNGYLEEEKIIKDALNMPQEEQSLPLPPIESTYNIPEINERPVIRPQTTRTVEYTPPTIQPGRGQTTENVRYQVPTQITQPTKMTPQMPAANMGRKDPRLIQLKARKEDLEQQKNALRSQRDSYAKNNKDYKAKDAQFKNFEKNTYLPAKKAYEDYARSIGL